jgi:hypothetical protein
MNGKNIKSFKKKLHLVDKIIAYEIKIFRERNFQKISFLKIQIFFSEFYFFFPATFFS